jgi:HEPN domain-containing protein
MDNRYEEWLNQAEYDMGTADAMYGSGRYIYAAFMCHLSIEKALKALFVKTTNEPPPKTHNLLTLLDKIGQRPDEELERFIAKLNTASVATRYPDELAKIQAAYTERITAEIVRNSKEALQWVKNQL